MPSGLDVLTKKRPEEGALLCLVQGSSTAGRDRLAREMMKYKVQRRYRLCVSTRLS
jgi:hypothetical protein